MSLRGTVVVVLGLVLAAGCDGVEGRSSEAPTRTQHAEIGSLPGGASRVTLNGVPIEVTQDVRLTLPVGFMLQVTDGERTVIGNHDGPAVLVEGEALDVVDGRLLLGGVELGPVGPDSQVRIDGSGVTVDGELVRDWSG